MSEIFSPQKNLRFQADPKRSLMDNLLEHGLPVASSCRGDGICGKCRMRIRPLLTLPPPSELEKKTLEKNKAEPDERLSCQIYPTQNLIVETTYW